MTFLGETEHFSGKNGALRWSILVGKQKHNVQKPSSMSAVLFPCGVPLLLCNLIEHNRMKESPNTQLLGSRLSEKYQIPEIQKSYLVIAQFQKII